MENNNKRPTEFDETTSDNDCRWITSVTRANVYYGTGRSTVRYLTYNFFEILCPFLNSTVITLG